MPNSADLLALEPQPKAKAPGVEAGQARRRVDCHPHDLLGVVLGDLLDLHAALGRGQDGDAGGGAVHQQREVQLALDVAAGFDIDAAHLAAGGAGLLGDQRVAEHGRGGFLYLGGGLGQANAALALRRVGEAARAAATGVDLAFHHEYRAGELGRGGLGLLGRPGDIAFEHRDAVAPQQLLALVFVDVHWISPPVSCRRRAIRGPTRSSCRTLPVRRGSA